MPLSDLITALAAATGASRELDERVAVEVFGWKSFDQFDPATYEPPAYTSSLDAITGALEQRWPDRFWSVGTEPRRYGSQSTARLWRWDLEDGDLDVIEERHRPQCPALALCLAAARLAAAEEAR